MINIWVACLLQSFVIYEKLKGANFQQPVGSGKGEPPKRDANW
jgi:hypothetical protein